jgi:hypothetical protein
MNKKITLVCSIFSFILLVSNVYAFCIDRTPPSVPGNLVIHDSPYDADGNMTLTWTAATDGPCPSSAVLYYKIYRSNDSVNFTLIGNTASVSFDDFSSLPNGKYYYRVTAVDNVIDNPHEGPAVEGSTTVGQAPAPPSGGGGGTTSGGGSFSGGGLPPTCTEKWNCTDWSECMAGTQTRTCKDDNKCGTTKNKPTESQTCSISTGGAIGGTTTPECTEDWLCSDWSDCIEGTRTETCVDKNNCGTTINKPTEAETCSVSPATGLFLSMNTPVGYGIAALILAAIVAIIYFFFKKRKAYRHKPK